MMTIREYFRNVLVSEGYTKLGKKKVKWPINFMKKKKKHLKFGQKARASILKLWKITELQHRHLSLIGLGKCAVNNHRTFFYRGVSYD